MKKISLIAGLALVSLSSQATNLGSNFDVSVTLTSQCVVKTASTGVAFSYAAFQTTSATASSAVVFECTRGLGGTPTVALDTGTDATSAAAGQGVTGAGVVGGLRYTLAVAAGSKTNGTAATTADKGTGDQYSYAISGSMEAGQAGDASKGTTQTRTLTVSY